MRLFFFEKVHQDRGMGKGSVRVQSRCIEYVYTVCAVGEHLFFYTVKSASRTDGFQLAS